MSLPDRVCLFKKKYKKNRESHHTSNMNMKLALLAFGMLLSTVPLAAQAMSVSREVVCYHFKGAGLAVRDVCRLEDFDTSSTLTWTDGVVTRIRWVSRYSETPNLDGVPAREYERDPATLEILERPIPGRPVTCLQALESNNSVCWSN